MKISLARTPLARRQDIRGTDAGMTPAHPARRSIPSKRQASLLLTRTPMILLPPIRRSRSISSTAGAWTLVRRIAPLAPQTKRRAQGGGRPSLVPITSPPASRRLRSGAGRRSCLRTASASGAGDVNRRQGAPLPSPAWMTWKRMVEMHGRSSRADADVWRDKEVYGVTATA